MSKSPSRKREGLGEGLSAKTAQAGQALPRPLPQAGGEIAATLATATARLASITPTPRLDAELLMAHALGTTREALLLDPTRFSTPASFATLLDRRLAHEPVAYILGHRDFWTIRLSVGPGVLIPRSDSETLIEAAIAYFGETGPATILDLGTGPGTLLLAALDQWPQAHGLGIDNFQKAITHAQDNALDLGVDERARFRLGDWATDINGQFDLIFCNPPYIAETEILMPDVAEHEPHCALFAGSDGMDDYRKIIPAIPALLKPTGIAILEIGATQRAAVTALAEAEGLTVTCRQDLGGRDRALILSCN